MNVPRLAQLAAQLLREPRELRNARPEDEARGIATIQRALAARRQQKQRLRWLGGGLATAAGLLLCLGLARLAGVGSGLLASGSVADGSAQNAVTVVVSPTGAGAQLADGTRSEALQAGAIVQVGSEVQTAGNGGAILQLSTGTRLELDSSAALSIQSQGAVQSFKLSRGALFARVAKLAAGERFVIDTVDAEIEVRGTAFRLEVVGPESECVERTRLSVSEGVVEVRSTGQVVRVAAGDHWPTHCERRKATEPPAASATSEAKLAANATRRAQSVRGPGETGAVPSRDSTLALQSDLFARALAAQKKGASSTALALYAELLTSYPQTPLAENALVGRLRVLSTGDRGAARREAQRYLDRYPTGFARTEAAKLLERE